VVRDQEQLIASILAQFGGGDGDGHGDSNSNGDSYGDSDSIGYDGQCD
jgi:hypothetical protein